MVSVATTLGVRDKTVFGTRATEAFLRSDGTYKVLTNRGDILTCDFLVLAQGVLSTPKLPDIEGLSRFRGELIHSSSWPRGLDLTGRTVGVIGTGATAVQLIPEAAKKAKQLYVFQRTPTWAGPRDDELTPSDLAARIRAEPGFVESLVAKRSAEIDLFNETLNSPAKNERLCRLLGDRIASVVDDPTVAAALTPTYNDFDIDLTHLSSLASTNTVAAVPCRVVYTTLPDAFVLTVVRSVSLCVQIGASGTRSAASGSA